MKISFYEILGMIKDEKQPKKIVYDDIVYKWTDQGYFDKRESEYMSARLYDTDMLKKNITILESTQIIEEDKDIEEVRLSQDKGNTLIGKNMWTFCYKINELVREVNKLKNK